MQIMALLSGLDVENNVCDSAQKESQSWNLKQVQAQHCGYKARGVLGSACQRGSWMGMGKCQSLVLEVPDSLMQGDSDKLWHCRWDTGENSVPRKSGADL